MMIQDIFAALFIIVGLFFLCISGIGLIRLPDFYSRNHAVGKSETLGSILLLIGLAVYNGLEITSGKMVIILLFIALANPTATHIVARAAFRSGLQPWVLDPSRTKSDARKGRIIQSGKTGIAQDGKL
jgi:multicomponent Na+:H+ antiporter subunit G